MLDPQFLDRLLDFLSRRAWIPAAALVIGVLVRAAKEPAVGSLFARIPRQHRPRVVLALGVVGGVLDAIARGTPWSTAIVGGLVSGALAIAGHGALGGVSPEPAPAPHGALPISSEGGVLVSPDLTPTPEKTSALEQPVVDPSESWGPRPSSEAGER